MYYDAAQHSYIDRDTGEVVLVLQPGDIAPQLAQVPPPPKSPTYQSGSSGRIREETPQERSDRLLAEQLSREGEQTHLVIPSGGSPLRPFQFAGTVAVLPPSPPGSSGKKHQSSDLAFSNEFSLNERDIYSNLSRVEDHHTTGREAGVSTSSFLDFSLARALQAMEFEIEAETWEERRRDDMEEEQDRDFRGKEYGASSCRKQMLTISTFVCIAQICIFIAMCTWDGMAPQSQNPMYGPPATTMVRFGAKDTSLILYRQQWWRLFSPIFLHAGVIHILSNVLIQLRVGGYLNLVFGNANWCWIYLVSGLFGNVCSCCFLPDSVGVGSSGALLGMLSAWIVWIVFRWKKIPEQCRGQRNCQLGMVIASVAITLGMSFSQYVDWGAHFGGAIMGILWGIILLSNELDNKFHAKVLRVACLTASAGLWIGGLTYMNVDLFPSKANWPIYAQNDDWNHHNKN